VVYVLSGGAASGLCHLGMIEALEARGTRPDLVVGTSAGALFGALYSHFGNIADVSARVTEVLASREFRGFESKYFGGRKRGRDQVPSRMKQVLSGLAGTLKGGMRLGKALVTSAMVSERDVAALFALIFEGVTFKNLKVPFAAVATDLAAGVPVILTGAGGGDEPTIREVPGPDGLMKAVMASCAVPLVFPAVEIGGRAYTDGMVMANLPVREARKLLGGQDAFLAGFDVSAPVEAVKKDLTPVELILRLIELSTRSKQGADRELVDFLLRPVNRRSAWSLVSQYTKFLDVGRKYMGEERVDAFEDAYLARCGARVRGDWNAARRLLAGARLRRLAAPGSGGAAAT
jgi:NTE family protein